MKQLVIIFTIIFVALMGYGQFKNDALTASAIKGYTHYECAVGKYGEMKEISPSKIKRVLDTEYGIQIQFVNGYSTQCRVIR